MGKNWIAINVTLMLLSGLLGWRLYTSAMNFKVQNDVARIQPAKDPKQSIPLEGGLPQLKPRPPYNVADFAVIPSQNVFSDTRTKDEPPPAVPPVAEAPPLTVRPLLVGVILAGDQKLASVVEPAQAGGPHRSQTRRIGDTYQGYTITDITRDQMVLERGNRREVIPLFDAAKHPAQGAAAMSGKTPILPTRVVSIGGGGSGTAQPGATGVRSAAAPGASSPALAGAQAKSIAPPQQGRQVVPAAQQTQQPAAPPQVPARRVIRTPFGDVQVNREP